MAKDARNIDETTPDAELSLDPGDTAVAPLVEASAPPAERVSTEPATSLAGGLRAMREVRAASRRRAETQSDIRDIEAGLEEDKDTLAHRVEIDASFDDIIAEQTAEMNEARAEVASATAEIKQLQREIADLQDKLRALKEHNEQTIRPYRNLADSSRGRSDDAAKVLANARRDLKSAERAMSEATRTRDARIAAAHRDVDNAQERLSSVEVELEDTRRRGDEEALSRVEAELAAERSRLELTRSEVERVMRQEQDNVDQVQKGLLKRQRDLASAEQVAEAAKEEANARKTEYDALYKDAQAKERAKEDEIKSTEERVRDIKRTRKAAQERVLTAEDLIDEATEIHEHPEVTEGLRQRIADEELDLEDARAELKELQREERELRSRTRGARIAVFAVAVLVLIIIFVLLWFFVLAPKS